MTDIPVTESLFSYFAAHPIPPLWSVGETLDIGSPEIKHALEECLASIDNQTVDTYCRTSLSPSNPNMSPDTEEREARIELFQQTLDKMIAERRLNLLRQSPAVERPMPYDHPALNHIELRQDHLVDMSEFHLYEGGYSCNNYVFNLAHILAGHNSSYWINRVLQRNQKKARIQIRLDPFRIQPTEQQRQMCYKMLVWGVPLDWKEIKGLQDEQHGRWMPSILNVTETEYTDVCWKRRGKEIHFACEEVPNSDQLTRRGSRYLHAIYDPDAEQFLHADGALRFYSAQELDDRRATHVRKAGKIGTRVKIFQMDGYIEQDVWCTLALSFFVWNRDMQDYFDGRKTLQEGPPDSECG